MNNNGITGEIPEQNPIDPHHNSLWYWDKDANIWKHPDGRNSTINKSAWSASNPPTFNKKPCNCGGNKK